MNAVRIEQMLAESGLAGEEMTEVLDALAPLEDLVQDVPAPSPELAALFGPVVGADARPGALLGARRRAVTGVVVLALSGVGATGLSAAANTLPRPLQHGISQFSHSYLPFDLPEPPAHRAHGLPAPMRGSTSVPTERDDGSASRSIPGRDAEQPVPAPIRTSDHAAPSYAEPSASPSASESAEASPMAHPSASGSPTPPDRTDRGSEESAAAGKGHQAKGPETGKNQPTGPGTSQDSAGDPGDGNGNGNGNGKGGGHGKDGQGSGTGAVPDPTPQPEPPTPSVPLPEPVPDLGLLGDGSVVTGPGNG